MVEIADVTAESFAQPFPDSVADSRSMLKVTLATMIGSAIEAFDFLTYGTAAALVFNKLFFPTFNPTAAQLAAFGAFAAGFFARPVGGLIFGHYGDRLGRKKMLMLGLVLMGVATVAIGLLPTYASIGLAAPILLIVLRIAQGISFGGEYAGGMLMMVEHAPAARRSFFGSLPQGATPVGLMLSTGAFALASLLPEEDFLAWGWRVPFLASVVMFAIGAYIRRDVAESPVFVAMKSEQKIRAFPARDVIRRHWRSLLLLIGGKLGEVTLYFTLVVFSVSYAIGTLGFSRSEVLRAITVAAAFQIVGIPLFGWLGDKVGSRRLYIAGGLLLAVSAVPLVIALGSGSALAFQIAVIVGLSINYAAMFGPQSHLYSEQFPPELRYSGMSIGIQVAGALGGGLAPIVATTLIASFGTIQAVGVYLAGLGLLAAACAFLMRQTYQPASQIQL
ncbi:MFS transporter [Bradyrhizobium prioriisuperbiae]|uniref:MFS transporter n=1 Tax=Bradyrhizobium prioriisuperbiae TaxID=2854389 RepID=UPI0028E5A9C0|nr:MFS transporter [Bradyrhizobium prioritasuperba]